ncbi:MAG: methylmalonyl-CoA mutase family protein, partial [Kofleriaceae bacterium]
PWDQQWSLRLQQILAYETDLLEYGDIFTGNPVIEAKVQSLIAAAKQELAVIEKMGGIRGAIETGYCKQELVRSMTARMGRIERGEQIVVGVNKYVEGLASPLVGNDGGIFEADPHAAENALASLAQTRATRDSAKAKAALAELEALARAGKPIMEASIACALARVTTGEWAGTLRNVWGEYRAETGVGGAHIGESSADWQALRAKVEAHVTAHGRRPRLLVGKPGLDGHSNGAEIIAVAARDAGFEVIYAGIRLEPAAIAAVAVQEAVDVIGLSVLSGSHVELAEAVLRELRARGGKDVAVVLGGTVPPRDHEALRQLGIRRIFTPSDFKLVDVIGELLALVPT